LRLVSALLYSRGCWLTGSFAVVSEINQIKAEINESYDHLDKWAKPVKVKTTAAWALASATVYNVPKGTSDAQRWRVGARS
jgi:hypothetical protein